MGATIGNEQDKTMLLSLLQTSNETASAVTGTLFTHAQICDMFSIPAVEARLLNKLRILCIAGLADERIPDGKMQDAEAVAVALVEANKSMRFKHYVKTCAEGPLANLLVKLRPVLPI